MGFGTIVIDLFVLRTKICNLRITNVTSHPEYIPVPSLLLRSMRNEASY